MVLDMLKGCW